MTNYCETVKRGQIAKRLEFKEFLEHVSGCADCVRRLKSQFITEFKQRERDGDAS